MASRKTVHQFGVERPSGDGNFNVHVSTPREIRDTLLRPLPGPQYGNKPPYQMDLASIISDADIEDGGVVHTSLPAPVAITTCTRP